MTRWGPEPIAGEVRHELARFGPAAGMADLVTAWPDAVGAEVARNAWPARIARDGTLHVHTADSTWAFELGHHAATILERLREALGDAAPPALRFAAGNLPEPAAASVEERAPEPPRPGPQERAAAAELTASLTDPALRELVARAAAASLAKSG